MNAARLGGNAVALSTRLHIRRARLTMGQARSKQRVGCGTSRCTVAGGSRPAGWRRSMHTMPRPLSNVPASRCAAPVLVVGASELVGTALVIALRASGVCAHPSASATEPGLLPTLSRSAVVLVDLDAVNLPVEQLALVQLLADRGRRVLVLSDGNDPTNIAAAVAAGAVGYVSRSAPFPALVEALDAAVHGRPVMSAGDRRRWLDLDRQRRLGSHQEQRVISRLTPRERAVLQRLALGQKAAIIAAENGVSLETVRSQIRSIRVKLGVTCQLEAVALLRASGD